MATRFYFSSAQTAPQSTGFDSNWTTTNSVTLRKLMNSKMPGELLALGVRLIWAAPNSLALDTQFVSEEVDSQFINGTLDCHMAGREFANADNSVPRLAARVITPTGAVRGTFLAAAQYRADSEAINNATLRNIVFSSLAAITSVTAAAGDRIVVETGWSDLGGTTPEGQARYGAPLSISDFAVNETTTTSLVGWAEFSTNISMFPQPSVYDLTRASMPPPRMAAKVTDY